MEQTDDSKFSQLQVELSSDGSATLFVPGLNEHYHSVHGARNESMHVFIEAGLKHISASTIKILEIGMGTGLNVLLTAIHSAEKSVEYHTIEKYPLKPEIYHHLNYFTNEQEKQWLWQIHESSWNQPFELKQNFTLLKKAAGFMATSIDQGYNLIYYDAFAPEKQPEMWEPEIFEKIYNAMAPGGILVTYCAKGHVRRMLKDIGFRVERIPGPPFKRHMTRAIK